MTTTEQGLTLTQLRAAVDDARTERQHHRPADAARWAASFEREAEAWRAVAEAPMTGLDRAVASLLIKAAVIAECYARSEGRYWQRQHDAEGRPA